MESDPIVRTGQHGRDDRIEQLATAAPAVQCPAELVFRSNRKHQRIFTGFRVSWVCVHYPLLIHLRAVIRRTAGAGRLIHQANEQALLQVSPGGTAVDLPDVVSFTRPMSRHYYSASTHWRRSPRSVSFTRPMSRHYYYATERGDVLILESHSPGQ